MQRVPTYAAAMMALLAVPLTAAHGQGEPASGERPVAVSSVEERYASVATEQAVQTPGYVMSVAMPKDAAAGPALPPAVTLLLKADLGLQNLTVMEGGRVLHVWPISSGRRGYATPTGTFRPAWMAKMWRSRQYDDAPMPHSIFFNGGVAFHATSAVGMLGRPASHGCLRLAPANAAELYGLVRRHGLVHTKVVVQGSPSFAPVAVARRAPAAGQRDMTAARPRASTTVSRYGQPMAASQWLFTQ